MITASTLSNNTLTVVLDNGTQILSATKDHPKWADLVTAYTRQDEHTLIELLSMKRIVEKFSNNGLVVADNGVFYKDMPLAGVDVDRILSFLRQNLPYQPIANYMVRKMANPSRRAITEMYNFLEHKHMPLTPDGKIIAYKGVQKDFFSVHSGNEVLISGRRNEAGQIFNGIGEVIEMHRSSVDDDFRVDCSNGLHAGSLSYAKDWAKDDGILILVEIDPADVVSVPSDCNCSKLRCCKYKVIGIYNGPLPDAYLNEYSDNKETLNQNSESVAECPYCHGYDCDCETPDEEEEEDECISHINPIPTPDELNNTGDSTANINSIIPASDNEETAPVIQNPDVFHITKSDTGSAFYKKGYDCGYKHGKSRRGRLIRKSDVEDSNRNLDWSYEYKRGYHNGYVDGRTDYKIKVYV